MTHREELLAELPVAERRLVLAGISTAVLEGGAGPPLVLLHGPGGYAANWLRVIPGLVRTYRVIAPDLPGHGASESGSLEANDVLAWLGALIEETCLAPPALVGHLVGGAIAAAFARFEPGRVARLVLVDTFGLTMFEPAPAFGLAIQRFLEQPDDGTHTELWKQCARDPERLRREMGPRWKAFTAYNIEQARSPRATAALIESFGRPLDGLANLAVPTALVWGRHDRATPLSVADEASRRYGWPLHIVEDANDAPPIEQPTSFLAALRLALEAGR